MQQNAVRRIKCSCITVPLDLSLISTRIISKKNSSVSYQTILELLFCNKKLQPEWDLSSSHDGNEYYVFTFLSGNFVNCFIATSLMM